MSKKKYWFKRRRYGWGWTPSTWQGWLVIVIYLFFIFGGIDYFFEQLGLPEDEAALFYLVWVFFLTLILVALSYFKGPKGKWRWGKSEDDDPDLDY